MARKVLSVCYEECLPASTLEFLQEAGCEMTCCRSPGCALQQFDTEPFDLILINQTVSTSQERLFVHEVRLTSAIPIIFVSDHISAMPEGVNVWLKPPISPLQLMQVIAELAPDPGSLTTETIQ